MPTLHGAGPHGRGADGQAAAALWRFPSREGVLTMARINVQSEISAISTKTAPGPERACALRQLVRRLQQAVGETSDLRQKYHLSVLGRPVERLATEADMQALEHARLAAQHADSPARED
jgi:hypothetical protein